jgi:hypothetical protein
MQGRHWHCTRVENIASILADGEIYQPGVGKGTGYEGRHYGGYINATCLFDFVQRDDERFNVHARNWFDLLYRFIPVHMEIDVGRLALPIIPNSDGKKALPLGLNWIAQAEVWYPGVIPLTTVKSFAIAFDNARRIEIPRGRNEATAIQEAVEQWQFEQDEMEARYPHPARRRRPRED